jgi:hypothetical protein
MNKFHFDGITCILFNLPTKATNQFQKGRGDRFTTFPECDLFVKCSF